MGLVWNEISAHRPDPAPFHAAQCLNVVVRWKGIFAVRVYSWMTLRIANEHIIWCVVSTLEGLALVLCRRNVSHLLDALP